MGLGPLEAESDGLLEYYNSYGCQQDHDERDRADNWRRPAARMDEQRRDHTDGRRIGGWYEEEPFHHGDHDRGGSDRWYDADDYPAHEEHQRDSERYDPSSGYGPVAPRRDGPSAAAPHGTPEPYAIAYARWLLGEADYWVTGLMATYAVRLMQLAIGIVFVWFGALKLAPGLSPAEPLVMATLDELFDLIGFGVPHRLALTTLAAWEMAIGIGFLSDRYRRLVICNLAAHMCSTATPLVLLPSAVWTDFPVGLTMEGQYIVKNLVIVAGATAVGATARGGQPAFTSAATDPGAPAVDAAHTGYHRSDPAPDEHHPDDRWYGDHYGSDHDGPTPGESAPQVWIVNNDGSLVATYELDGYYESDLSRPPARR